MAAGVAGQIRIHQLGDEVRPHDAARRQAGQRINGQFSQRRVARRPDAKRQAEALFFLADDLVRQKPAQRLFEKPAQFQAFQFVVAGQAHREIKHHRFKKRKPHRHARQPGGAAHFGQVTLGQGVAPVKGQRAVELGAGVGLVPHRALLAGRVGLVDARQKIRRQHRVGAQPAQQVVHLQALGHRHFGLLDITGALAQQRQSGRQRRF